MATLSRTWTQNLRLLEFLKDIDLIDDLPTDEPGPRVVLSRRCCPLHDGADNPLSLLIFKDGYACQTHDCHKVKEFGPNLFGLVRHLVYRATGRVMDFRDANIYARRHKADIAALVPAGVRYRGRSVEGKASVGYTAEDLAACLSFPDGYYLGRGYRPETLETFGVGTCVRPLPDGKYLPGWSILPVFDDGGFRKPRLVGYTARNPAWSKGGGQPKWVHGVARGDHLFNFAAAQYGTEPVVICEGPGDAMRWFEAGFSRAVAVMGAAMTFEQKIQLFDAVDLAPKVFIAADADEAGEKLAESVHAQFRGIGRFETIYPLEGFKDFGEMQADQIRRIVKQQIGTTTS